MTLKAHQSLDRVELEALAGTLVASGDFRVLRRLIPREYSPHVAEDDERTGIVLDVETTGLDVTRCEIISIAMVRFTFGADHQVTGISGIFEALNQPSTAIPPSITRLTGITDCMVAGKRIDVSAVESFASNAKIVAHNAQYDRAVVERFMPFFVHNAWTCSANDIDWKSYGFSSAKLIHLATESGFFFDAHRAINDCHAVLELLSRPLPGTSTIGLGALLDRAARKTCRIWAEYAPYDLKDVLKARGYRWSAGENGSLRCWYVDVDEEALKAELRFLREEIYQRDVDLRCATYTAFERHSARIAPPARLKLPAGRDCR